MMTIYEHFFSDNLSYPGSIELGVEIISAIGELLLVTLASPILKLYEFSTSVGGSPLLIC
jgi:hypothetical protein